MTVNIICWYCNNKQFSGKLCPHHDFKQPELIALERNPETFHHLGEEE